MAEWKTRSEVARLSVSRKLLGYGMAGDVYLGRIWFKGKRKATRVAVKRFTDPHEYFEEGMEALVPRFERAIERLKQEKFPIAKTAFVNHNG